MKRVERLLCGLSQAVDALEGPALERLAEDPFRVLIACILSLRTKDEVTETSSRRLFDIASTPEAMVALPTERLAETIYPCAFYRVKAGQIQRLCRILLEQYGGRVPDTQAALLSLPGVGLKTANLVLSLGLGQDYICVDTHVHRISNRLGLVQTKTADETEAALQTVVPRRWWQQLNRMMVVYGQQICQPVSPWCSRCTLRTLCPRVAVTRSR